MHRIWIALYNSYDAKLHDIHKRTIARAAPLCYAFGLNLALIDFPFSSIDELVQTCAQDTTIGHHGSLLTEMFEKNKLLLVNLKKGGFPAQLGIILSTTSHPDEGKSITKEGIKNELERKPVTLMIGLGRKGLPKKMRDAGQWHFDLTGKNIPFETCTALGALAYMAWEMQK